MYVVSAGKHIKFEIKKLIVIDFTTKSTEEGTKFCIKTSFLSEFLV